MHNGHCAADPDICHKSLLRTLDYSPWTGVFIRKVRCGWCMPGSVAGGRHAHGYRVISLFGRQILAHRLAWFYVYGEWPKNVVDHINGIKDDNRIANLRDVSHKVNCRNLVSPSKNNSSGFLGVHFRDGLKKPWRSGISYDGRFKHLGYFETPEEAHAAYLSAREIQNIEPKKVGVM